MSGWIPEPGETDHGALTGLGDNDHPQYLLGTLGGQGTINVVADAGSAVELDLTDGNDHDITLTEDCTITLTGATNGVSCYMTVLVRQDGTGGWGVTWPVGVSWVGGVAPALQSDPSTWDLIVLLSYDGGTSWFGHHSGVTPSSSGSTSGEILISDDPSTPLVFADLLQNEAQDDLIYAD